MKRLSNLLAALVFASLVIFMSCGGGGDDPAPSAGEVAAGKISGSWDVSGTPTFGGDVEGDWSGFNLSVSNIAEGSNGVWGGNFTASGIPVGYGPVWGGSDTDTSVSGTWSFASATNVSSVVRGDGVSMALTTGDASLESLQFTVSSPARTSGIYDALWVFQF